jgi:hypothetical protein
MDCDALQNLGLIYQRIPQLDKVETTYLQLIALRDQCPEAAQSAQAWLEAQGIPLPAGTGE